MAFLHSTVACQSQLHAVRLFIAVTLVAVVAMVMPAEGQERKIAIFGSSVANGSGDTTGMGGYAGLLKELMESRGWQVVNVSRGGDNTLKILPRFDTDLVPQKPRIVLIGLSLGNEGIASASELRRQRVAEQFRSGLQRIIRRCRENGMIPVVAGCYARNDFGPEQYRAIRNMNMEINTWDVASIDMLGAIDDGSGKWAEGYFHDRSHPNAEGHREMFFSIVPGLFDALDAGKKIPEYSYSSSYLLVDENASDTPLTWVPEDPVHSFSVSFMVKSGTDGAIALLKGAAGSVGISLQGGRILFDMAPGTRCSADTTGENGGWQYVTVTYLNATGTVACWANGRQSGLFKGHMDLRQVILGGRGDGAGSHAAPAGYRNLFIHRAALTETEVEAVYRNTLLQSSLEVYAPLDDRAFSSGVPVSNLAQSNSRVIAGSHGLVAAGEPEKSVRK